MPTRRCLSRLPIDCLKIDRMFVSQAHRHGQDAAIAQAVISLAHSLGVRVIAEGIETVEQLEFRLDPAVRREIQLRAQPVAPWRR